VYIANVVKCRPPGNRDPEPEEISACRDYLDRQIEIVDPKLIVTLGRFSMARWFPGETISRVHGKPRVVAGRTVIPMYHPAAALHRGDLRSVIAADFAKIPELLAGAPVAPSPPPPRAVATAAAVTPDLEPAAPQARLL
jgi:DNA polymerase